MGASMEGAQAMPHAPKQLLTPTLLPSQLVPKVDALRKLATHHAEHERAAPAAAAAAAAAAACVAASAAPAGGGVVSEAGLHLTSAARLHKQGLALAQRGQRAAGCPVHLGLGGGQPGGGKGEGWGIFIVLEGGAVGQPSMAAQHVVAAPQLLFAHLSKVAKRWEEGNHASRNNLCARGTGE